MSNDYKVKNINQADFGRKEISLAETEMPGLMALRKEYKNKNPLKGAKSFLDGLRQDYQLVILSDTFYEFASPLMKKLGWPTLMCHRLNLAGDGKNWIYRVNGVLGDKGSGVFAVKPQDKAVWSFGKYEPE